MCPLPLSSAIMAATDAAPAVDPAPASEAVEEVKVDDKPEKAPKEKKAVVHGGAQGGGDNAVL